jgi:hypothetical protein
MNAACSEAASKTPFASEEASMASEQTSWSAVGSLFEGCNCELLCPCHVSFRQKPSYGNCDAIWGVHFAEGSYSGGSLAGVSLEGVDAAVVASCPGPTMADGNWRAVLYLDQSVSAEQEHALLKVFSGEVGGPWAKIAPFYTDGKFESVHKVQLLYTRESRKRTLQILGGDDVVRLEVEAIRGADRKGVAKLVNLFNVMHGREHVLARSTYRIHDKELQFEGSGKHGLYSEFRWSGP